MKKTIEALRGKPRRALGGIPGSRQERGAGRRLPAILAIAAVAALAVPGHADIGGRPSKAQALTGVTIVTRPGAEPQLGTLIIRDGLVSAIGDAVAIPADAIVHDRTGRWVYAGFVEPYLRLDGKNKKKKKGRRQSVAAKPTAAARSGHGHDNARVRPELRAADHLPLDDDIVTAMREAGYTAAAIALARGIFRGTAAVVTLAGDEPAKTVLVPDFAQVFALEHGSWPERTYPNSLMGAIALARQTLMDVDWQERAWRAFSAHPEKMERPEENLSLTALQPVTHGDRPLLMESEDLPMLPRVLAIAREFSLRPIVVAAGHDAYERPEHVERWLEDAGARLILTVDFPTAPRWDEADQRVGVELDALIRWERAPTNPGALAAQGIPFAVTTAGLDKRGEVHTRLRTAIRHGLSEERALAALTTEPAELLGLADRLGTLTPGKAASLVVTNGPLFAHDTEIEEVWIDGIRHGDERRRARRKDVAKRWLLTIGDNDPRELRVQLKDGDRGFSGKVIGQRQESDEDEEPDEDDPEKARTDGAELTSLSLVRGVLRFTAPAADDRAEASFELRLDGTLLRGEAVTEEGSKRVLGRKLKKLPKAERRPVEVVSTEAAPWPPVGDVAGAPAAVHVINATVWTQGPQGIIEDGELLLVGGRVRAVGQSLDAPGDAHVIDAAGRHVTPGLIDCHSHSAITGGGNEGTHSATAEVRIADVLNPRSAAIYRELAGGLTMANMLHGSANAIGGQNAVIKLRWGLPAAELVYANAPQGIKFALGENVKQSNWGDDFKTRYPQTRMGVEQFFLERFDAAVDYRREWQEWHADERPVSPRRDLQLDALVEIIEGERLVHSHSYRADEIIMLLRVAERYGFTVATLQHVLEGYKAADEIAAHGAGASTFADWWSYKFEVVDAIPYNGALMHDRGVNVTFNSDSRDLARRMNLEAAKAMKYGGVPAEEALAFVTINAARQLAVDQWVGSLEAGKDGDFVIWSGPPLSDATICDETWIDGVRRFSREADHAARAGAMELRDDLLARAERAARWEKKKPGKRPTFGALWGDSQERLERGQCEGHEGGGL